MQRLHLIYDPNASHNGKKWGHGAEVRIHRAGCADIKRDLRRATSDYVAEFAGQREAAEDFFADFIDEGSMTAEDAWYYTDCAPCVTIPEHAPDSATR